MTHRDGHTTASQGPHTAVSRFAALRESICGRRLALLAIWFWIVGGCSVPLSTFEIIDYRESTAAQRYRETFDEAYYDLDEQGNVDLVLRRTSASEVDPHQTIVQVIHIRSFWRSIPGATVAHRSQINGTVVYHIIAGGSGETFEGAGSVFFARNRRNDTLTGTLELVHLRPKRQLASGSALFERAELTGRFHAIRDPLRVVRITNEMRRLFGSGSPRARG